MAEYTIIGDRTFPTVTESGQLINAREITFTWGTGFTASLQFNAKTVTTEEMKTAIQAHIAKTSDLG